MQFSTFPRLRTSSLPLELRECLGENAFQKMLGRERRRALRSGRTFLLMVVNAERVLQADPTGQVECELLSALCHSTRETDIVGWYREGARLGIIFAEICMTDGKAPEGAIRAKVTAALRAWLDNEIEFLVVPECLPSCEPLPPFVREAGCTARDTTQPVLNQAVSVS